MINTQELVQRNHDANALSNFFLQKQNMISEIFTSSVIIYTNLCRNYQYKSHEIY